MEATGSPPLTLANWDSLKEAVAEYSRSDTWHSIWQIVNTMVPYIALWVLMYFSLRISYWLTLALAVLAAGFRMRIFIMFHDAGHGSFFKSPKANEIWGIITGLLTFTAFHQWRREHNRHHASAGDLDRRGVGDVWTMTVDEWLALSPAKRWGYRLYRHPLIMFFLGPLYMFLIAHRFPGVDPIKKDKQSVMWTNIGLVLMIAGLGLLLGFKNYLLIEFPIIWLGGIVGVWMFYVQHQFEGVYWEDHKDWDYVKAALQGSSYYKLPKILQWFSGNIGIHHLHHLNPRIPNYKLQACYDANPQFHIKPITFRESLKCVNFRLYDEENHRMVDFHEALRMEQERTAAES